MSDKYESLKDKLFKLKALAERGVGGEADNARRLLLKLCADNGIDLSGLDDAMSPKDTLFKVGRSTLYKTLFMQCYAYVTNNQNISYRTDGVNYLVEVTPLQAAQIRDLFEWHKVNIDKEFKDFKDNFMYAYVQKHGLVCHTEHESDEYLSKEDLERLMKAVTLMQGMSDRTYIKSIENK